MQRQLEETADGLDSEVAEDAPISEADAMHGLLVAFWAKASLLEKSRWTRVMNP